jgi:Ni,Fe-hydrogenase III large subunit
MTATTLVVGTVAAEAEGADTRWVAPALVGAATLMWLAAMGVFVRFPLAELPLYFANRYLVLDATSLLFIVVINTVFLGICVYLYSRERNTPALMQDNRFGRGWIRPGAAKPIGDALRQDLLATLRAFLPHFQQVNALLRTSRSAQARFQGVGIVSTQAARDMGLTGVVARASGLALDLRHALPGAFDAQYPTQPVAQTSGDCWARTLQRMNEAESSAQWLIDRLSDVSLDLASTPDPHAPGTNQTSWVLPAHTPCVSLAEGVRGPVMLALETDNVGQLIHAKVQDPSLANWFGLAWALRNQAISDFPICNKSFDLSYCGNDL